MIYVGVDVAKNTHYACVINNKNQTLKEPFSFSNNESGFEKFHNSFKKHPKNKVIVGLEATSHYGDNLMSLLKNPQNVKIS
jgi:transposase